MAVLLFNKYKGDRVRVLLVWELRGMLQAIREIMQQVKQGLLSFTIVRVKGIWQGTDDLDAYDSDCDDISLAKAVLMANLSSNDSNVLFEIPRNDTYQNDDMINQSVQETLDLEPLSPKLLKKRDAHIDYIKHTQEHADTLREIVKHTRALRPLDSDLDSACKYVKRIQEVLVYVIATCPTLTKPNEKLVAVTPLNKNKKVSSTSTSRSKPSVNTKKNRISQTTSSNQKNKVEDHPRSVKSSSNEKNRISEPVCNANVKCEF
ncbi:hypothetical protein Tco_1179100 [Tanacetum coccineum]